MLSGSLSVCRDEACVVGVAGASGAVNMQVAQPPVKPDRPPQFLTCPATFER